MSTDRDQTRRRVVIGLNAVSGAESSVAAGATLAAAIEAEMVGVFQRREAMLDAAELPFSRVVRAGSSIAAPVSRGAMEQAITRREGVCRKVLSVRAERLRVRWSFRSAPEEAETLLEAESLENDLVVLPRTSGETGMPVAFDRTSRAALQRAAGIVFADAGNAGGPVVAIDDGDAIGAETVRLATRIADVTGADLDLLAIAASAEDAGAIADRAREIAHRRHTLRIERYPPGAVTSIANALHRLVPSFVVADLKGDPFGDEAAQRVLLRAARAPVVLLRDRPKVS